jgi:hypothetical protein
LSNLVVAIGGKTVRDLGFLLAVVGVQADAILLSVTGGILMILGNVVHELGE